MTAPINLLDLTPADALERLREFATASGEPAYRAAQVVRHLWERPAASFASMTALPIALRAALGRAVRDSATRDPRATKVDGWNREIPVQAPGRSGHRNGRHS